MTKTKLLEEIKALIKIQKEKIDALEHGHKARHSKDRYLGRIEILEEMLINVKLLGRTVFGSRKAGEEKWVEKKY